MGTENKKKIYKKVYSHTHTHDIGSRGEMEMGEEGEGKEDEGETTPV